jgi:hypothetical protein
MARTAALVHGQRAKASGAASDCRPLGIWRRLNAHRRDDTTEEAALYLVPESIYASKYLRRCEAQARWAAPRPATHLTRRDTESCPPCLAAHTPWQLLRAEPGNLHRQGQGRPCGSGCGSQRQMKAEG